MQPDDCWASGPHTYICSSAFACRRLGGATLVYSDPPWSQGNLASFRTKAGLGRADHTWLDLYGRIVELAELRPCFIEGGLAQSATVQAMLAQAIAGQAGYETRCWPITYYRRHPAVLHYAGPAIGELDPAGLDDDDTPGYVLSRFPAGEVADPCAGRGLTSRAAHKAGWSSVSVELHPQRMSAAMARMRRLAGYEPKLIARSPLVR